MGNISKDLITLVIKSEGADKVTVDFDKIAKGVKEIELEAKDAKSAIRMLKDENKSLAASIKREEKNIKGYAKSLKELAESGDTSSSKVKALQSAMDNAKNSIIAYKAKTFENNETVKQAGYMQEYLTRNMKVSDMTATQLSRRAEYLRGKLNNIVKEKDLQTWNKYNDQLIEVEKQQKKVAAGGEQVKSRFDSIGNTVKKVLPLMVAYAALRIFQNIVSGAIDWIRKAPEVAAKAEGVSRAFNKLNNSGLMTTLRKETKGLINDLVLMQSTVRADRFGIPINNLAKYLKFAQQRAQETGQSVDYLSESIINGIGRKSPLILDNLGISAARLKAEMKSGLDFAQATTKIVEEELAKQGDLSLTSADKATQAAVKWENAQLKVGNRLKWLSDKWNEFSGSVADGIGDLAGDTRTASEAFDDQIKKVSDLEVNTVRLMPRYEELVKKAYKTKKEHEELNGILQQVAKTMPIAVTEWDKYGNAIAISTQKVYSFIRAEEMRLKLMYEDKIGEKKEQLVTYVKELEALQKSMDILNSGGTLYGATSYTGGFSAANPLSNEEITKLRQDYAVKKAQVIETNELIDYMNGSSYKKEAGIQIKTDEMRAKFYKMEEKQLKEWINNKKNANSEYLKLAKQIYDQRVGFETPPKEEKESKILARQKEELKTRLENLETAHKYELMAIKADAEQKGLAEDEYQKRVLESEAKYYNDRIGVYDQFVKDFKITNDKFKEDIKGGKADAKDKLVDISPQVDKNRLNEVQRLRDEELRKLEEQENQQRLILEKRNLSAEQYDYELQVLEMMFSEKRLEINRQYGKDVEALELQNGRTKQEAVRESNAKILADETELIKSRNALQRSAQEANFSLRSQYGITTRDEEFAREQKILQANLAANVVDYDTYQKLLSELNRQYENDRLQLKQQYNIAGSRELYDAEMAELLMRHEQGYLSEEEFEKAKWQMKLKYATEFGQKITQLTGNASSAVSALMAAETAQLDAEYDVRIAAAEGNKEETERLENEKAQKKLDIEKKYADVQFAVKASEIIASTAVAIMTGYAQLGPVMGSIAAVMLGITGAAQLAAANAEREKVKNMTLGGSGSSAGSTGVIVAGREEGGYLRVTRSQDGKPFNAVYDPERRGFVDGPTVIVGENGREWVASNRSMKNPTIAPVIGLIDEAQRNGTVESLDLNRAIKSRMAGFASGGSLNNQPVSSPVASPASIARNEEIDREMIALLKFLKDNGVYANIGVTELEAQKALKQRTDNMFTLKDY